MLIKVGLEDHVEAGQRFLEEYAKSHYRFTGGDVLQAWRNSDPCPASLRNWRNVWASRVIQHGKTEKWFLRVGRKHPTSPQSHTKTLALWQSKLFQPAEIQSLSPRRHLDAIRRRVHEGNLKLLDGLFEAYTFGMEEAGHGL